MGNGFVGTNLVCQVGLVVRDVEQTAKDYAEFLGMDNPPVVESGTYEEAHTQYKGEPSLARCKMAFFNITDNFQLELIQPDEEKSTWRDGLDENGEGFHHLAFFIKGTKEKIDFLESKGFPLLQKGDYPGGRYAYVDTRSKLKMIIELLEND
jgi:catechol 2,3-dioxygenase-like lactoylglutathione lyase family enzyme